MRRLNRITLGDMDLLGYSVGGEETVIAVPGLNVCFDIGKAPDEVISIDNVLLTHGHMDHAAGIAYYCSQRHFREMATGRVLLPTELAKPLGRLLDCWACLDGTRPPADVVPLNPGQEYELRRNLFAYTFETNHNGNTLGYSIVERRQKLKSEFLNLSGHQIASLREEGVPVTYTLNLPLVTYLGDTMQGGFMDLPCVRQSRVLIAECTFIDDDHYDRARAGKHFHISDLARILPEMENEYIVLHHLSRRTDIRTARKRIKQLLPDDVFERVHLLMERPRRKPTSDASEHNAADA